MNNLLHHKWSALAVMAVFGALTTFAWANPASYTLFTNTGSIVNTRHNLTQQPIGAGAGWMSLSRNDYGEVCVYCHTPHGANTTVSAPLWNRTNKGNTYTLYNIPLTSGQAATQPGVSSLTCLSCHDGTVAIDSIVNMPGSGRYSAAQLNAQNNTFLDTWPGGPGSSAWGGHGTLSNTPATLGNYGECMACHSPSGDQWGSAAPNFDSFFISTDLTNDHPVGVQLPDTNIYDFNAPTATNASLKFYDTNANSRTDPGEIRFYNTGEGYEVECASCHDPHGVPSAGPGSQFNPTFLRISNAGSAVCLTCHNK